MNFGNYEIVERLKTTYHAPRREPIAWIVVHYTGTAASGIANARALERPLKSPRSTHYFIDGNMVYHCVDERTRAAWHVGGVSQEKRIPVYNQNSIGVDLCERKQDLITRLAVDKDWFFTEETEQTAAEIIAILCLRYGIDLDHVVRHYDVTRKLCPRPFVGTDKNSVYGESGDLRWEKFKKRIGEFIEVKR